MSRTTLLLVFIFIFSNIKAQNNTTKKEYSTCISEKEYQLYQLVMAYRAQYNLPKIPLSKSLTYVARTHAKDLELYNPNKKRCNMHSWSANGPWTSCCYTPDHKVAECMWYKPRELTNYPGYGYEIAHWSSAGITPQGSLNGWKSSKGHNDVIINRGMWKKEWKAIGIGIYKNYAIIWFGHEEDPDGSPVRCNAN